MGSGSLMLSRCCPERQAASGSCWLLQDAALKKLGRLGALLARGFQGVGAWLRAENRSPGTDGL